MIQKAVQAEPIPVLRAQGSAHGFLILRTLDGKQVATGDLAQVGRGDRITSRLIFRFRDGSIHDETTIFLQRKTFELVSDHILQRGPSFPDPLDSLVLASGDVTIRSLAKREKDGQPKVTSTHFDLPPDTYNGMLLTLLMNLSPTIPETKVALVAPTGKGRLIHLSMKPDGEESFTTGGTRHQATIFRVHFDLGGVTGVVAPVIGKQPEDVRVWVLKGESPEVVKVEGQLREGGPILRMEMVAPVWSSR